MKNLGCEGSDPFESSLDTDEAAAPSMRFINLNKSFQFPKIRHDEELILTPVAAVFNVLCGTLHSSMSTEFAFILELVRLVDITHEKWIQTSHQKAPTVS
jgi:hypothetical protein